MKKIDLGNLPRRGKLIDWKSSIGCKCKFIYDDIEDEIEIIEYKIINNRPNLIVKYGNKIDEIPTDTFTRCRFGKILGKRTNEFKVNIGEVFKDDERNIIITDREYRKDKNGRNWKWYKYTCNKCGWTEGWITEYDLSCKQGCSCCCKSPRTVVPGINDIPTTAPWMVKYFQGGEEEASKYTCNSGKKIHLICPDCSRVKNKPTFIQNLYKRHSIGCNCSDGKPYDEKLFYHIVNEQLGLNMLWGANKNDYPWMDKYIYDFVDEENKIIWELDGGLGHGNAVHKNSSKTIEETIEDDKYKDELAKNNGYKVIRIDTHYKNNNSFEYIKNSISKSIFSKIYDAPNLNWQDANKFALKNLIKELCEYYEEHKELTQKEIMNMFKLSSVTVHKYLKQGEKLGWCSNVKERAKNSMAASSRKSCSKKVLCIELNEEFDSVSECARQLNKRIGEIFNNGSISSVCRGKTKQHNGFHFKYINC